MYNMSHLSDFHIALDHGQNPGVSQRTLEDRKEEQGGGRSLHSMRPDWLVEE